jgi:hypothetical protein
VGTALIVGGLKVTTQQTGGAIYFYGREGPSRYPHAGIKREHPKVVTWRVRLLLLGLALQVVASIVWGSLAFS